MARSVAALVVPVVAAVVLMPALAVAVGQSGSPDEWSSRGERLVEAAQRQDHEAVRALLSEGVDVNVPQGDGAAPLAWATYWDDLATVELLLRAGADVNAANDLGVTPLMLACDNRNAVVVEKLLRAGADASAVRSTGDTALMMAARTGSVAVVTQLLDYGADVNAQTPQGQTALMWALAEGHADVADALIRHGADISARTAVRTPPNRDYSGRTPVLAPVVLSTTEALNPVFWRDRHRQREASRPEGGFTALLHAVLAGDPDCVRVLLNAGANVNEAGPDGVTALILALVKRHEQLAIILLEQGADPSPTDAGYTALHVASATGQVAAVKALLAHGANPNARLGKPQSFTEAFISGTSTSPGSGLADMIGATPFMVAAKAVDARIMRVLATGGADPLLVAEDMTTAVMVAAGLGKRAAADIGYYTWDEPSAVEAITVALELGVDINAANEWGETALHGAAYHAANDVIQFLVDKGANINATNGQGQTPLRLAEGHLVCCTTFVRHPETVDLLHQLGVDPAVGSRLSFGLTGYVEDKLKEDTAQSK